MLSPSAGGRGRRQGLGGLVNNEFKARMQYEGGNMDAPRRGMTCGTRLRMDMKVFSRTMAAILSGFLLARSIETAPPMDWPYRICIQDQMSPTKHQDATGKGAQSVFETAGDPT